MAGRPRKMAENVARFEEQAIRLSAGVSFTMPEQYRTAPDPRDPFFRAWAECELATMQASIACERLGNLIREKAGIPGPSPTQAFLAERLSEGQGQPAQEPGGSPETEASETSSPVRACAYTREGDSND